MTTALLNGSSAVEQATQIVNQTPEWTPFLGKGFKGRPASTFPIVNLRPNNHYVLSAAAVVALGEPTYVEVLISADRRRIAFRATSDPATGYKLIKLRGWAGGMISGAALNRYLGVSVSKGTRLPTIYDGEKLVMALPESGYVTSR